MVARMKGSRALKEIVPVGLAACVATAALLASPPEGTGAVSTPSPPSGSSVAGAAPAPSTAAIIAPPTLPEQPAAGKGRLTILFSGNRRWCTFPDDRTVKPPPDPRKSRQAEAT